MTFLNPFLLLGLVAAAIPILLHLLNLRKLRTIEFSTLHFLKELQKTKIRRLKIKQLLLLLLRTLLVLLVVLAFARPTLTGTFAANAGGKARTSAVILFDDSYSMSASNERGEYRKQAIDGANRILDLLKEGDEVFLLRLSETLPQHAGSDPPPQRNFAAARASLHDLRPSPVHRSLDDAVRYSARLLSSSTNLNKEIYILSDFQEGAWTSSKKRSNVQEGLFPAGTRFFLLPIGLQPPHNLGIERVAMLSTILEVGKPVTVKAWVRNSSSRAVENHLISVFLGGMRVAQKGINVAAGKSVEVEFSVVPKSTGFLSGSVELESDDLDFDNRRYFSMYVPERIRVLLCGSSSDHQYIRLALSTRIGEGSSAIVISELSLERLSQSILPSTDVVVLSNISALTVGQVNLLKDFLHRGGGVIIFPGRGIQPTQFNSTIASVLQIPSVVGLEQSSAPQTPDGVESLLEFQATDFRHPLFQGMFDEEQPSKSTRRTAQSRSLSSPRIKTSVRFLPTASSLSIITLSNGAPFLLEHPVGRGRALLFAVAADAEWSDFPLQGLFVPLLHRSVSYLVREQEQPEVLAGEQITLHLTIGNAPTVTIKTPDEVTTQVPRATLGPQNILRFGDTQTLGIYMVTSGSQVLKTFVVNMNPTESLTQPTARSEIEAILERLGIDGSMITFLTDPADVQRIVLQARFGVELWKHFLIAALLIALIEMAVARDQKKDLSVLSPGPAPSL